MATPFSQSLRSIEIDGHGGSMVVAATASVFLGGWLTWFFVAPVTLHEAADTGRIEVAEAAKPLNAAVGGRIVAMRLALGTGVQTGDVLVELDSETERRQLAEERTRAASVEPELEALRDQLRAERGALSSDRAAMLAALDVLRAKQEEASLDARLAREEALRAGELQGRGSIPELDFLRAQTDAQRKQKSTDALRFDARRLKGDSHTRESQAVAHIDQLRLQMAELEGARATSLAKIGVLETQIAMRLVRAPADGVIGEVAPEYQVGSFVRADTRLGALIPRGHLKAIADFAPDDALGRIRRGQRGRMRVEGYPWAQYGTVPITVRSVASEAHNSRIRVELDLDAESNPRIPLEHGLPGSVEVDVETSSPARLALRYAGSRLGASVRESRGSGESGESKGEGL